jgi:hypothetical protein
MDRQRLATTNVKSGYEVLLDAPGRYLVVAIPQSVRAEYIVDVPSGREFEYDIVLSTIGISGRVVTSDGKPVNGAHVDLSPRAGHNPRHPSADITFSHRTDADGHFTFSSLPRARFALCANSGTIGAGKDGPSAAAAVAGEVDLTANDHPDDVVIVVATGAKMNGIVRKESAVVANAYVFVFTADGAALNPLDGLITSKEGKFETFALPPGRYFAVAANGPTWSDMTRFEVPAEGEGPELTLDLHPAAKLPVDIHGLEPAWIDVRDANNCSLSSLLDMHVFNRAVNRDWSSTSFVFRVPSGNYDIAAIGTSGKHAARASLLPGQELEVRLSPR